MKDKLHTANAVTASRIVFAWLILFVPAFSVTFYALYLLGAATDMIDGYIARKLSQQSAFGAKLDTAADIVFFLAVLFKMIPNLSFPLWLWIWTAVIAGIKVINLISGFAVCHRFVAVHSIMNKITGGILFFLPLLMGLDLPGQVMTVICIIICATATFAAVQEGHYIRIKKQID